MGSFGVCGLFSMILWVLHFVSWDWLNFIWIFCLFIHSYGFVLNVKNVDVSCWLGNHDRSFMNFSYDRGCVICVVWLLVRYVVSFGISFWDCLILCFIVCRLSFLFFCLFILRICYSSLKVRKVGSDVLYRIFILRFGDI